MTPVTDLHTSAPRRPDARAGVFDTLLVQGGVPVALEAHLARLTTSVREVYGVGLDPAALASGCVPPLPRGLRCSGCGSMSSPGRTSR